MLVRSIHCTVSNAFASLLEHPLQGARAMRSMLLQGDRITIGLEMDTCPIAQRVRSRSGPTITTLLLVHNKGTASQPLCARIKKIGDLDVEDLIHAVFHFFQSAR